MSTFDLKLDGGPGSPLENKFDLCKKGARLRAMKADVAFTGQNGATVASRPAVHVPGCGPAQTVSLRRAASARPVLVARLRSHPDGGKLARFSLTLPKELRLNRSRARAVRVKGRTVTVGTRPKQGASTISLRLDRGAVRLTGKARRTLLRKHRLKLRYKIVAVETDGDRFRSKTAARARR